MSAVVRSVFGASLLLTGASAAMAQSANAPVANSVQTGAFTAVAVSNNAPVANQSVQTGASIPIAAAPIADQPKKSPRSGVTDNNDPYGGHDPNSTAGNRAFFVPQY